ncbi:MAG: aminodeoxychorismate synthase, component I [Alphaproteobacteria bacterium MedPE-SWcel]|nr:MAG: aminodeoxychorismate synthase, component I [Alphaproteobacteria bacterium MedPE-SWcel]
MRIRFDNGPEGAAALFAAPLRMIRADDPADVPGALAALDEARARGHWVAGYATYELGYVLEPRLMSRLPGGRRLPLLQFGVYAGPQAAPVLGPVFGPAPGPVPAPVSVPGPDQGPVHGRGQAREAWIGAARPRWTEARYTEVFERVKSLIAAGDIYQANLTFPMDAPARGSAAALYGALAERQPVGHGALIEQEGLPSILSRSPELFFRTSAGGMIETRPMKGTQPRSDDPAEDARRCDFLRRDEKNRAENLMIVDLLRNDISRIAEVGSVEVPELFRVESYATVHQMVSKVRAQLVAGCGLAGIFGALFPCGSITGAPKIRAMEILQELEPWPRDLYCGTIGWAAPGGEACFNVAIRTVMLDREDAMFNVGGGVVWDSTAPSEYEEALWKARFAQGMTPILA